MQYVSFFVFEVVYVGQLAIIVLLKINKQTNTKKNLDQRKSSERRDSLKRKVMKQERLPIPADILLDIYLLQIRD